MDNFNKTKQLAPNLKFSYNGEEKDFSVLDLWRWNGSDLLTHTYRGAVAEFIVSNALNVDTKTFARYIWADFDIEYTLNDKCYGIEIKTSGYLDGNANVPTVINKPKFSIAKSREYIPKQGFTKNLKRWADLYVFCLHKEKDWKKANALILEQWEFYVISTKDIDNILGEQKSVTLNRIKELSTPANFNTLKETINKICLTL